MGFRSAFQRITFPKTPCSLMFPYYNHRPELGKYLSIMTPHRRVWFSLFHTLLLHTDSEILTHHTRGVSCCLRVHGLSQVFLTLSHLFLTLPQVFLILPQVFYCPTGVTPVCNRRASLRRPTPGVFPLRPACLKEPV